MKDVHLVVGVLAIAFNAAAAALGAWRWWRAEPSTLFWRLLRLGQLAIVVEAALGGVLVLAGRKSPSLHVLYGVLPLLVAFIAEHLRLASAQMVLDQRELDSAADVGRLPESDQREVALAIVQRELGVMVLAALVVVGLLARAATTG